MASSIFFVRDANVWVANPDGTAQHQITADGANIPYVFVSTGKSGPVPLLAFQRSSASNRPVYGTINPDGTDYFVNPYNSTMSATNSFTPSPRLDVAGDRVAYSVGASDCSVVGQGCVQYYVPESVGVDGSHPALINSVRGAYDVTFGDPTGATLLFEDLGSDYLPPAACARTNFMLVRQAPQPAVINPSALGQASFYCVSGTDLVQPALRPDGQLIAATAQDGKTSRIVTIPISGFAAGAISSLVSPVTPATSRPPDRLLPRWLRDRIPGTRQHDLHSSRRRRNADGYLDERSCAGVEPIHATSKRRRDDRRRCRWWGRRRCRRRYGEAAWPAGDFQCETDAHQL